MFFGTGIIFHEPIAGMNVHRIFAALKRTNGLGEEGSLKSCKIIFE
jgi:hypothetical protein